MHEGVDDGGAVYAVQGKRLPHSDVRQRVRHAVEVGQELRLDAEGGDAAAIAGEHFQAGTIANGLHRHAADVGQVHLAVAQQGHPGVLFRDGAVLQGFHQRSAVVPVLFRSLKGHLIADLHALEFERPASDGRLGRGVQAHLLEVVAGEEVTGRAAVGYARQSGYVPEQVGRAQRDDRRGIVRRLHAHDLPPDRRRLRRRGAVQFAVGDARCDVLRRGLVPVVEHNVGLHFERMYLGVCAEAPFTGEPGRGVQLAVRGDANNVVVHRIEVGAGHALPGVNRLEVGHAGEGDLALACGGGNRCGRGWLGRGCGSARRRSGCGRGGCFVVSAAACGKQQAQDRN